MSLYCKIEATTGPSVCAKPLGTGQPFGDRVKRWDPALRNTFWDAVVGQNDVLLRPNF
jgi:hypothetical protein